MKDATILTLVSMLCATSIALVHDAELLFPIVGILAAGGGIGTGLASYSIHRARVCSTTATAPVSPPIAGR
jgi:hypothetical protein